MTGKGRYLLVAVFAASLAHGQYRAPGRIDWGQARLTAQDLVEDSQRAYMEATRTTRGDVVRLIFTAWADSEALTALLRQAPGTAQEVMEGVDYARADFDAAVEASRSARLPGNARSYLMHARETLDRLAEDLGAGGGGGYEPPSSEPYPDDALDLTLSSDGWHGNFFDRYTHLSGVFKGMDLRQADIIVTDAQGYSMWHRDNAFPEIAEFYRTHRLVRDGVVEIPFRMKFQLNRLPSGSAWFYVRLRDARGNYKDQGVPIPSDYTKPGP